MGHRRLLLLSRCCIRIMIQPNSHWPYLCVLCQLESKLGYRVGYECHFHQFIRGLAVLTIVPWVCVVGAVCRIRTGRGWCVGK